jgi:hypothetical protein
MPTELRADCHEDASNVRLNVSSWKLRFAVLVHPAHLWLLLPLGWQQLAQQPQRSLLPQAHAALSQRQ